MDYYLISSFNEFGINFDYKCPGCNAQDSPLKTPLTSYSNYFLKSIPKEVQVQYPPPWKYVCSSHRFLMKSTFESSKLKNFIYLQECTHFICNACIYHYLTSTFNRYGMDIEYTCPGCSAECSPLKTLLDYNSSYFINCIPKDIQEEEYKTLNEKYEALITTRQQKMKKRKCFFSDFSFYEIICNGTGKVEKLVCQDNICQECMLQYIQKVMISPELKCFNPQCLQRISHEIIKNSIVRGSELFNQIIPMLTIDGFKYFTCPNKKCRAGYLLRIEDEFHVCDCGYKICCQCGNIRHENLPCFIAINGMNDYREIECSLDDPITEYRAHYLNALALFEWDLHQSKKLELQAKYGIKLKVTRVKYIYNPVLFKAYQQSKQQMIINGIDPGEKTVFHATLSENYTKICKNGFLIGGIDTKSLVGKAFGYGISTSVDATMAVHFYNSDKVLLCKGLTGNLAEAGIFNTQEFLNTKFNSLFIDFHETQSNYYIFFQRENVLPYYLIEYE